MGEVRNIAVAAIAAWLTGADFSAASELGRITATLDGEERTWYTITLTQGGTQLATASLTRQARVDELRIQGHPIPEFTSKEALSIDALFEGGYAPGDEPVSVELLYTPNGLSGPLWISRDAPTTPRLQVVELDVWGRVGRIVAVISGDLCKRPSLFSLTDTTDCKHLNGKIESRLDVR